MKILITGGSGSGKSAYAEGRVMEFNIDDKYYLATMQVFGAEGQAKVDRHRRLREGKGFTTIECQRDVNNAADDIVENAAVVLLECVSNLVANEMFQPDGSIVDFKAVAKKVVSDIKALSEYVDNLVIVTNEVFSDTICYDDQTISYIKALGLVNQQLTAFCDEVIEVVVGIPVAIKSMEEKLGD